VDRISDNLREFVSKKEARDNSLNSEKSFKSLDKKENQLKIEKQDEKDIYHS